MVTLFSRFCAIDKKYNPRLRKEQKQDIEYLRSGPSRVFHQVAERFWYKLSIEHTN